MAWIVPIPPSPRHPKPRWQLRYQDGTRDRSAGIYQTPKVAEIVRKRIKRGLPLTLEVVPTEVTLARPIWHARGSAGERRRLSVAAMGSSLSDGRGPVRLRRPRCPSRLRQHVSGRWGRTDR
jgi:hypothetical protein